MTNPQATRTSKLEPLVITRYPLHFGKQTLRQFWIDTTRHTEKQRLIAQLWCLDSKTWQKPKTILTASVILIHTNTDPCDEQCGLPIFTALDFKNYSQQGITPHTQVREIAEHPNNHFSNFQKLLISEALTNLYADNQPITFHNISTDYVARQDDNIPTNIQSLINSATPQP